MRSLELGKEEQLEDARRRDQELVRKQEAIRAELRASEGRSQGLERELLAARSGADLLAKELESKGQEVLRARSEANQIVK